MLRLVHDPLHPGTANVDYSSAGMDLDWADFEVPDQYDRLCVELPEDIDLTGTGWFPLWRTATFVVPSRPGACPEARAVGGADWADWFEAHWTLYRDTTSVLPSVKPANLRATFGQALEPGNAVWIGTGFASLRGMRAGIVDAGWIGGTTTEVAAAVQWCLARAAETGARAVRFEATDTDPPLWSVLGKLANADSLATLWEKTA